MGRREVTSTRGEDFAEVRRDVGGDDKVVLRLGEEVAEPGVLEVLGHDAPHPGSRHRHRHARPKAPVADRPRRKRIKREIRKR